MTLHVFIEGMVQNVGFRQFVRHHARKLNITGWVQNLPDQSVEAVLSGDQDNLRKMVNFCQRGPFLARVKNVKVDEVSEQSFSSFDIIKQ